MNSPEFTPEPWSWPIWAQREKDIKALNLKDKFYDLGAFYVADIGFWTNSGENVNSLR
ncbi:hypothetical protein [Marinobacter goseongensis]|jgi:hypothetical protein|uniref:hypothetical protein n=1 Tax=Marinobacter goseongensis TaxID=453838 RepID=UPI002005DF63|nr:hypothetical protein [Marinobacter goseongensis]MCK7553288.1 hypothetical protein [Marinobacter goseongensis]|tara:strand:+ start:1811 stop:1984 length:174 start_codon:yes stop_codon:yes gene_type:complete